MATKTKDSQRKKRPRSRYKAVIVSSRNPLSGILKAGPTVLPPGFDTGIGPAPADDSETTRVDLHALIQMQREERTPSQLDAISRESLAETAYEIFNEHGLSDPDRFPLTARFLNLVLHEVDYFIARDKDRYGRVRPTRSGLEPALTAVINVPSYLSYPSKHAGEAYAVACALGKLDPSRRSRFQKLASDIARRREIAGLHYPSDTRAARQAAEAVVAAVLQNDDARLLFEEARNEYKRETE